MIQYTKHMEENTEVRVVELDNGSFSVVVYDVDANMNLPFVTIFKSLDEAINYVEKNF